jgi:glycosyltransferase involved in cell wall biosynthesis
MRILHVAETIRGGTGTYLNEFAPRQIAKYGDGQVRLIVPDAHASQLPDVDSKALTIFRRPDRSVGSLLSLAQAFEEQMVAFKPDVIHAHSTFAGAVVRLSRGWRRARTPIIYCPHGWVFDTVQMGGKRALMMAAERIMAILCDRIVAISGHEAARAREIGIADRKVKTILNGIAAEPPMVEDAEWPGDRLKLLFVGRLDRQKGFDVLLKAIEGLKDSVSVRVAGEAVLSNADSFDHVSDIDFLGWVGPEALQAQIQAADLMVMPSRWEGFGLVALEAMRAGKPVLASRVGGLPEIVEDRITGILTPVGDAGSLRKALVDTDRVQWGEMGKRGRERFLSYFTADRTEAELNSLYGELVASR